MHVESVRRHLFDQLSAEQLLALRDIQMTLLDHLLPIANARGDVRIEAARGSTCPTRALSGSDARAHAAAGACSPTASSPGACRSGTARSTRCSPTCATATGSPRPSSATSSPPASSPGSSTQLALARLADRGYAPMLVRGGILLAMAAMIGSAAATEFWAFLVARLLLGLGSGAVGPGDAPHRDHPRARRGRREPRTARGVRRRRLHARTAGRRRRRGGVRHPRAVRVPRRGVRRRVRARVAPRPHRRRRRRAHRRVSCAGCSCGPAIQATLAASIAFYLTVGMFEAIWAVLLRDHGAETWLIGLTLSLFTLPMIFLAPIGGRAAQSRGPLRVVAVSLTVATVCTFSYGVLPSLWMLLGVSIIHAVADSFTMPSNQVAAALGSPPEHLSAAQGLLGATGLAAAGLTGLAAGFVYEEVGPVRGVHRHRRAHGGVPRHRAHARSPRARGHARDGGHRRTRSPPTPSAAASPTCPEPDFSKDVHPWPTRRSPAPRRRAVHPPDRRHVRDRRHDRPVVDREGVRDGRGARRSLQLGFGLGKYTNRNVMDAYAGVSRGVEQMTVRASRRLHPDPELTVIGPIRYEVLEPLRVDPLRARRQRRVSRSRSTGCSRPSCRRTSRSARTRGTATACRPSSCATTRPGVARGWVEVDGERTEITPDTWVSTRDHSWGVRYGVGVPLTDMPPTATSAIADGASFEFIWSPMLMERPDGTRYALLLDWSRRDGTRASRGEEAHGRRRAPRRHGSRRSSASPPSCPTTRRTGACAAGASPRRWPTARPARSTIEVRLRHRLPPRRRPLLRVRRPPPRRMARRAPRRRRAHRRLLDARATRVACTRSATPSSTSPTRSVAARAGATASRSSPATTPSSASTARLVHVARPPHKAAICSRCETNRYLVDDQAWRRSRRARGPR